MGFINMLRGQAIDVIDWADNGPDVLVHRYDLGGKEIMMGAQLTVREGQAAVFVNEGQLADVFLPGRYTLSTANLPFLTKLQSWRYGFNSPFKADLYFISTRQFMDRKWGTANPVMMRDAEFGMIRVRAFGTYAFRVTDAAALLRQCFGASPCYKVSDIDGQIKRIAVSSLSDAVAESGIPALDLAANYDELGAIALQRIDAKLQPLGVSLTSFVVENISLPEEVEKAMDRRTSMGVVGNLDNYTRFQAAEALRESANNPSGGMGAGLGMGAGMAMGQIMTQSFSGANGFGAPTGFAQSAQKAPAQQGGGFCPSCGTKLMAGARFCSGCGAKLSAPNTCPGCGQAYEPGARFCPGCGTKLN